jgi:cytosine/adenosine deaminase-related metal-dependent hydrolase
MMGFKTLLRGGTILTHDEQDHVVPVKSDLLVEGGKIAKIEQNIIVDTSVQIVDCTGKIISPGFVDTHHHLWQTQLKGRHGDESLLDYIPTGMYICQFISQQ